MGNGNQSMLNQTQKSLKYEKKSISLRKMKQKDGYRISQYSTFVIGKFNRKRKSRQYLRQKLYGNF